ncbi:ATP-grasp domain-containing protein [Moorena producens]|uniref:ATP-grasp domain-containing protein n=1 Tax=Moorena producens TaxID=1155739 RepID=UPI003C72B6CD
MIALLKNIGTLTLLLIALPLNATLVFISLVINWITSPFRRRRIPIEGSKNILITGGKMTKALQLARSFHKSGHNVFLVETHKYWLSGHRFSNAVKGFYTVPAPEKYPNGYSQALLKIVQKEKIDAFIPVSSPVASYYDSVAGTLLSPYCEVIHFSPDITQMLDDKFTLCEQARSLGLSAPKSFLITDPQQILDFDFKSDGSRYIIKSIRYDSVSRLDMTKFPFEGMEDYVKNLPITKDNPWTMQEFITGQEYCTHSTVRKGKIRLHCCSPSSPFQVNYQHLEKPEIVSWVEKFVKELNLTGQISFDFIQTEDGTVYPIECNPRTHSAITMFYNHPGLADAYLKDSDEENQAPIVPRPDSKPTYWLYHEIWRLTEIRSWSALQGWIKKIVKGTDAIFQVNDPLPFLTVPHWQITLLLLENLRKLKGWVRIDFNIGKLVELGGD